MVLSEVGKFEKVAPMREIGVRECSYIMKQSNNIPYHRFSNIKENISTKFV